MLAGLPDPLLMDTYGNSLVTSGIGPMVAGGLVILVSTMLKKPAPTVWDFLLFGAAVLMICVSTGIVNCGGDGHC